MRRSVEPCPALVRSGQTCYPLQICIRRIARRSVSFDVDSSHLSLVDWLACRGDLSVEDNRLPDLTDGDRPELEGWQLDSSDASPCSPDGVGPDRWPEAHGGPGRRHHGDPGVSQAPASLRA